MDAQPVRVLEPAQPKAVEPEVVPVAEPESANEPESAPAPEPVPAAPANVVPEATGKHAEKEGSESGEDGMKGTCAKQNMDVVDAAKLKMAEIQERLLALDEQQSMMMAEMTGARERGVESARQLQTKSQALEKVRTTSTTNPIYPTGILLTRGS